MTRRAGMIEAPTGVVQPPNLGSGGAHQATVQVYEDLARAARGIGEALQPAVDANTEKRAREAVGKGDFRAAGDLTRQDQIYNKVIDAGFVAQASIDVDRMLGELETKHLATLNMEEFAKDNDAARTLYLENTDERYAVTLGQAWDQQALRAQQRLSGIATQKALRTAEESMKARMGLDLDRVSGASRIDDPEVSLAFTRMESVGNAMVEAGMMSREELDATLLTAQSRVIANGISDEAVASYAAAGFTDEAYAASMKSLDEAMASPDLALSRSERSALMGSARTALNSQRSAIKEQEREFQAQLKAARAEATTMFRDVIGDATTLAKEGYTQSPDKLQEYYRLAKQTSNPAYYIRQVDDLAIMGAVQQEFRGLSIPDQARYVQDLEREASQGNLAAAQQLDPVRKVAAGARKDAEADPPRASAARRGVEAPQIDWSSPDALTESMARRFERAEIAADELGVGVKYFAPEDLAKARAIEARGGADALKMITSTVRAADAASVDPLHVLEEVGGAGAPLLATAGAMIAQGMPEHLAGKIISGKAAMGIDFVKAQMPSVDVQGSAQRTVFGADMKNIPTQDMDARTRAADAYYADDVHQNNGVPPGGQKAAYERALRATGGEWKDESGRIFGGRTSLRNKDVSVPSWIAQNEFGRIVTNLTKDEIIRSNSAQMLYPTLGKYYGRDATLADYRSAKLIDAGVGRYYVAPDPSREERLILGTDGRPVVLDLNIIRTDLQARIPGAVR